MPRRRSPRSKNTLILPLKPISCFRSRNSDKIEKQVKRHRSKIRDRRSEIRKGEGAAETEDAGVLSPEEPIIETEKLVAKPMDPEEAAMQLDMSQQDFLVFRNSRSREINVIYKRRDGNLGLIEPSS